MRNIKAWPRKRWFWKAHNACRPEHLSQGLFFARRQRQRGLIPSEAKCLYEYAMRMERKRVVHVEDGSRILHCRVERLGLFLRASRVESAQVACILNVYSPAWSCALPWETSGGTLGRRF